MRSSAEVDFDSGSDADNSEIIGKFGTSGRGGGLTLALIGVLAGAFGSLRDSEDPDRMDLMDHYELRRQ